MAAKKINPSSKTNLTKLAPPAIADRATLIDWGEAPDVSVFYGRESELARLGQWVQIDRCRLIAILGMGGIGKTALVTKLAQQLQPQFTTIVWRSLRNAPLPTDLIPELIQIFSRQTETIPPMLDLSSQISRLIHYLRAERCLLVLDNAEAIIPSQNNIHRPQLAEIGYQDLIGRIGESVHQSCLLITSREKPLAVVPLAGDKLSVRTLKIPGLNHDDIENLFNAKQLSASNVSRSKLREIYSGNPLALNIVATSICDLFDGNIDQFLETKTVIFNGIQQLLDQQFEQLTPIEIAVMYWLTISREWISPIDLQPQIMPAISMSQLLTTLECLSRKSLIERSNGKFTQQAMVMEYTTARAVDLFAGDPIEWYPDAEDAQALPLWMSHPLLTVQSPAPIRAAQKQLFLAPIATQLQSQFVNLAGLERHLQSVLAHLRVHYQDRPHYGCGNLINLLRYWQIELTGYDFTNLAVWQADLQGAILHDVNFSGANLAKSMFTETFGWISAVAFRPDGQSLATAELKGTISLWQLDTKSLIGKFIGHNAWVFAIAFSPDGQTLASAGQDATIRLWDVQSGGCTHTLHVDGEIMALSLSFHPDGQILATSHYDGKVRFWNVVTGTAIDTRMAHTATIFSIEFSPDGTLLATGSNDNTVKIWDAHTGDLTHTLIIQESRLLSVRFSPNGQLLAAGGSNGIVQVWEMATWTILANIPVYVGWLLPICFSPDSQMLAASNSQHEVKIWDFSSRTVDLQSPTAIATLRGHQAFISSIQFSPDGQFLVTAGTDRSVRLWDTRSWHELYHWQGYTNWIWSVLFLPDHSQLITGSQDGIVRVWELETGEIRWSLPGQQHGTSSVDYHPQGNSTGSIAGTPAIAIGSMNSNVTVWDAETGQLLHTLCAHQGCVWKVRYSPDGRWLASSGMENNICLWSATGALVATLSGHPTIIRSLVFSPDSTLLATACFDGCWRLWDISTHQMLGCYQGHPHWIWHLAFSPDGKSIVTGSADRTAKLWDVFTGELLRTFTGHTDEVMSIEFSPDGQHLATGSSDRSIKIWDVQTGQVLQTLTGHQERISTLNYRHDGELLASGSADETIKLWDLATGDCILTCKPPAPYMGMNINGTTGLTPATIDSLTALGAMLGP